MVNTNFAKKTIEMSDSEESELMISRVKVIEFL